MLSARDYETLCRGVLAEPVFEHIAGGDEAVIAANRAAFGAVSVLPRVLRDLAGAHTRTALLGQTRPHPILLAPIAAQGEIHPGGELETARGAGAADACLVASTLSSHTLEEIAAAAGPDRWFQLYVQPTREVTLDLVRRAESAGYRALVVTLDAPVQSPSLRSQRAGYRAPAAANLTAYPAATPAPAGPGRILGLARGAPTWEDFDWLIAQTRLPVLVKGVLHPHDARDLIRRGAAGVIVSNHGGRASGAAPASLSALAAVRAAVGEAAPVLFDGGVRSGEDVFKAIALGADAVLVGRLQVHALAVGGALGVAHMIRLLCEELELAMVLAGCATLADVRSAAVGQFRFEPSRGDAAC